MLAIAATGYRLSRALPTPEEWEEICGDEDVTCMMRGGMLHAEDLTTEAFAQSFIPHLTAIRLRHPTTLPVVERPKPVEARKSPKSPELPRPVVVPRQPGAAPVIVRTVAIRRSGRLVARCRIEILDAAAVGVSQRLLALLVQRHMVDVLGWDYTRLTNEQIIAALRADGLIDNSGIT